MQGPLSGRSLNMGSIGDYRNGANRAAYVPTQNGGPTVGLQAPYGRPAAYNPGLAQVVNAGYQVPNPANGVNGFPKGFETLTGATMSNSTIVIEQPAAAAPIPTPALAPGPLPLPTPGHALAPAPVSIAAPGPVSVIAPAQTIQHKSIIERTPSPNRETKIQLPIPITTSMQRPEIPNFQHIERETSQTVTMTINSPKKKEEAQANSIPGPQTIVVTLTGTPSKQVKIENDSERMLDIQVHLEIPKKENVPEKSGDEVKSSRIIPVSKKATSQSPPKRLADRMGTYNPSSTMYALKKTLKSLGEAPKELMSNVINTCLLYTSPSPRDS
eukprot:TRINITY_DN1641_c0_g1_i1.p1 TRINITY_DN1641_c0_g1~~TRINITY_DN1641_c0_g1_i1.p1  ORF type:complete len:328 (-),score=41.96 TRINITY_DN1641_c0_g1_i1:52-1035(-)